MVALLIRVDHTTAAETPVLIAPHNDVRFPVTRILGHSVTTQGVLLFMIETISCFAALYLILTPSPTGFIVAELSDRILLCVLLALAAVATFGAIGLYEATSWARPRRILAGILIATPILTVLEALLAPAKADGAVFEWGGLFNLFLAVTIATVVTRLAFMLGARLGLFQHRIAVLNGPDGSPVLTCGSDAGRVFDDRFQIALVLHGGAGTTDSASVLDEIKSRRIWAVVAADPSALPATLRGNWERAGVRTFSSVEFRESRLSRLETDRLPSDWQAAQRLGAEPWISRAVRRGVDIGVSLGLLVLSLPLTILAAVAIKLDSPGPVFYRQARTGLGGRAFSIIKFRSMCQDAEQGCGPRWATTGDCRVTRVGHWLRLTRIDEIPQILNVLRGDMAFVGPRPERPGFVEQLREQIPHYDDRHAVKPGITGWAQVNFPYGASVEDARMKLAYDLYYVRQRSLFLDLLILIATVRVVLFREGAR